MLGLSCQGGNDIREAAERLVDALRLFQALCIVG